MICLAFELSPALSGCRTPLISDFGHAILCRLFLWWLSSSLYLFITSISVLGLPRWKWCKSLYALLSPDLSSIFFYSSAIKSKRNGQLCHCHSAALWPLYPSCLRHQAWLDSPKMGQIQKHIVYNEECIGFGHGLWKDLWESICFPVIVGSCHNPAVISLLYLKLEGALHRRWVSGVWLPAGRTKMHL